MAATVLLTAIILVVSPNAEAAALRYGDSGPEVARIQERLQTLGYNVGTIDGAFGFQTKRAIESLQADNGLAADGVVGDSTWEALRKPTPQTSRGQRDGVLASQIIQTAKRYLGVPYVWGGASPSGFDCSGFTQYVFSQYGINLPRTADIQFNVGIPVQYAQLQPGDMVYFSTYAPGPSHVGIYIGEGKFINATSSRGIAIDRMNSSYWGPRYIGAKRILR